MVREGFCGVDGDGDGVVVGDVLVTITVKDSSTDFFLSTNQGDYILSS